MLEWLEKKIPCGTKTAMYQLHRASRLLVTHYNQTGQQTGEHATEIVVPKDFVNMLLADGAKSGVDAWRPLLQGAQHHCSCQALLMLSHFSAVW